MKDAIWGRPELPFRQRHEGGSAAAGGEIDFSDLTKHVTLWTNSGTTYVAFSSVWGTGSVPIPVSHPVSIDLSVAQMKVGRKKIFYSVQY